MIDRRTTNAILIVVGVLVFWNQPDESLGRSGSGQILHAAQSNAGQAQPSNDFPRVVIDAPPVAAIDRGIVDSISRVASRTAQVRLAGLRAINRRPDRIGK